jgi:hypothetical protein
MRPAILIFGQSWACRKRAKSFPGLFHSVKPPFSWAPAVEKCYKRSDNTEKMQSTGKQGMIKDTFGWSFLLRISLLEPWGCFLDSVHLGMHRVGEVTL